MLAVEKELREQERAQKIRDFVADIHSASFADLISNWRKHVDYIRYNHLTARHQARTALYEVLVAEIEAEWLRRSKLKKGDEGYFPWPTTKATRGKGGIGVEDWAEEGMLRYLGYHVGRSSSLLSDQRHAILRRVFAMNLPPVHSPTYMKEWGRPTSAERLRKLANSLASFTRQAKLQAYYDKSEAVSDWESDLLMLHDEFYVGHFGFGWPSV